ncbi:MAG: MASE1 domain-containing protein [Pseudomonadota bacterium]
MKALRSDAVLVALLLGLYALCSWGMLWVYTQSNDVPAVYLASGITWAAFLLLGRREQLIYAIGAAAIQLSGEFLVYKASVLLAVTFTLAKILGPFIGARILGRILGHRGLHASLRDLIWFGIVGTVAVPVIAMLPPHLVRAAEFGVGTSWYVSLVLLEAIGVAVMTPLIVFWAQVPRARISGVRGEPLLIAAAAAMLLASAYFVLPLYGHGHTVFYATTPVMIWSAARFGMRGAGLINIVPTLFMVGTALAQTGPFSEPDEIGVTIIELQLFLLLGSGMALLLGAYAEAREHAQRQRAIDKRRLQDLSLKLLQSEEQYRDRIATRLHDGIGQTLSLGRMRLDDLFVPPLSPEALAQRVGPIQEAFDKAINEVRVITRDVAMGLYRGNDIAAVMQEHLANVFAGTKIETDVHCQGAPKLDHETAIVVSRAVRECLVNVAKHADAKNVRVDLIAKPDASQFVAKISDDGSGFDASNLNLDRKGSSTFGLSSVRNSMLALGGQFAIRSKRGAGTDITLTLPLP